MQNKYLQTFMEYRIAIMRIAKRILTREINVRQIIDVIQVYFDWV